jgi:3-oxoadipate enol-lactonase
MDRRTAQDWIDVNGVSLRYAIDRPAEGDGAATLVLIHEMGGSLDSWAGVIDSIPAEWTILRFDWRGMGLSQKIRGTASMPNMVEDLRQLLDTLGITAPVALAGCAVGAAIALAFAAAYPGRAAGVVAMAPATGIDPDRRAHALAYLERLTGGGLRDLVDDGIDRTFPAQFRDDPRHFRASRGRLLANDPDSYAAIYRMLLDLRLEQDLGKIRCPVVFVAGTLDRGRTPELVGTLVPLVAGSRLIVLETGHVMAVLTPALVAAMITTFLVEEVSTPAHRDRPENLNPGCEKLV